MFQKDFVWGVASSAYQIEGTDPQDGRGETNWDLFARAGKIYGGQNADVACDHMHRYKEDFAMMRTLGIKAYRFSVSWARILPEGTGRINEKAIAMYRDMIQEMLSNGITPYVTLFHWEFPLALQKKGGWLNEDSIEWFSEYAKVVAENFSDLAEYFITLNEPQCFIGIGNLTGVHAPGYKLAPEEVFQITHNALRAHGAAVKALRKYAKQDIKIGYAPTCGVAYPASEKPEDIEAARSVYFGMDQPIENWTWTVSWFSDPVFLGKYPEEGLCKYAQYLPKITKEDMELINQPLDFMGQNIYNGYCIRQGADGKPEYVARPDGSSKTAANWPVTPECLYWGVRFLYERYNMPIYITENGMSCHDMVSADGRVHDSNRIDFLDKYLSALQRASDENLGLKGYFLWTFLDNFEWEKGYNERFGIVYVDFTTQQRIVKDSAYWYGRVCETNGAILSINQPKREILHIEPISDQLEDYKIVGGTFDNRTLSSLWKEEPGLFDYSKADIFPLIAKIIDAKSDIHLDDDSKNTKNLLSTGDCCKIWEINVSGYMQFEQDASYMIVTVISGDGLINGQYVKKDSCFILPYGYGDVELYGEMDLLVLAVEKCVIFSR